MTVKRKILGLGAATVLALGLAACGDDQNDGTGTVG